MPNLKQVRSRAAPSQEKSANSQGFVATVSTGSVPGWAFVFYGCPAYIKKLRTVV
jgi:hypothetical protein